MGWLFAVLTFARPLSILKEDLVLCQPGYGRRNGCSSRSSTVQGDNSLQLPLVYAGDCAEML